MLRGRWSHFPPPRSLVYEASLVRDTHESISTLRYAQRESRDIDAYE